MIALLALHCFLLFLFFVGNLPLFYLYFSLCSLLKKWAVTSWLLSTRPPGFLWSTCASFGVILFMRGSLRLLCSPITTKLLVRAPLSCSCPAWQVDWMIPSSVADVQTFKQIVFFKNHISRLFVEILNGGVKFANNQLCNVETIQWDDLVNTETTPSMERPQASNNPLCKRWRFTGQEKAGRTERVSVFNVAN